MNIKEHWNNGTKIAGRIVSAPLAAVGGAAVVIGGAAIVAGVVLALPFVALMKSEDKKPGEGGVIDAERVGK